MTRIRGGQMAPRIHHNSTVHLIKMTLSRTAKHILRAPVQNSKAAVRTVFLLYIYIYFLIIFRGCEVTFYRSLKLLNYLQPKFWILFSPVALFLSNFPFLKQ